MTVRDSWWRKLSKIFKGDLTIQGDFDVGGDLGIEGSLMTSGLSVFGESDFYDDVNHHCHRLTNVSGITVCSDGDIIGESGKRVDIYARDIKELRGFGDANGKGVAIVETYAELKAACEDATVHKIYGLANITASATIAPTSYTYLDMLGHELDWSGAAGGHMFDNAAATYITYENTHWIKTGNSYGVWLRSHDKMLHCVVDNTGYPFYAYASDVVVNDSSIATAFYIMDIYNFTADSSYFVQIRIYNGRRAHLTNCAIKILEFTQYSSYVTDKDVTVDSCEIGEGTSTRSVIFLAYGAAPCLLRNIKLKGCTFIPTTTCIELENDAFLTVQDLELVACTFRDATNGILVPANATLTDPRFALGVYDNVTTKYNFAGTVNNPVYCMDG